MPQSRSTCAQQPPTKLKDSGTNPNGAAQPASAENEKARHRRPTAHARARYRCFLPDLAGLAGVRRAGPMPDLFDSNIPIIPFPFPTESPTIGEVDRRNHGAGP